jgi:hypothetical protein
LCSLVFQEFAINSYSSVGWTVQLKGDGIKGSKVNTLTMFSAVIKEGGQPPKGSSPGTFSLPPFHLFPLVGTFQKLL